MHLVNLLWKTWVRGANRCLIHQACELRKQLRQLIWQINTAKRDGSSRLVLHPVLANTYQARLNWIQIKMAPTKLLLKCLSLLYFCLLIFHQRQTYTRQDQKGMKDNRQARNININKKTTTERSVPGKRDRCIIQHRVKSNTAGAKWRKWLVCFVLFFPFLLFYTNALVIIAERFTLM